MKTLIESVGADSSNLVEQVPVKHCDLLKRDSYGLLEDVEYVYKDNHFINWRAMIKPEHTVINSQFRTELEQIHQKRFEEISISEVEDKYLLILLAGFKELASVRGYESVHYEVAQASPEYVGVSCRIVWVPNFETNNRYLSFEALADASHSNTSNFGRSYLMAMAENRAFVRCVRNSLGIPIVGFDEIGPKSGATNATKSFPPTEPHGVLQSILDERRKPFPKFKEEWLALGHEEARGWDNIGDVPVEKIYTILEAVKRNKK